ncbi:MAG: NAD-dependent epimerase/dehydratase family protein [Bacteroidota bacterium]
MASDQTIPSGYNILLTGGSGFLGTAIIQEILGENSLLPVKHLRVIDMQPVKGFSDPRISFLQGDVRDDGLLDTACCNIDLVIHSAAIVDWGTKSREEAFERAVKYFSKD